MKTRPANLRKALAKRLPGGTLSVTEALFPGMPKLYGAVNPEGEIVAQAESPQELTRKIRKINRKRSAA